MGGLGSVTRLVKQLEARDQEAANQIWSLYVEKLLSLARRNLSKRIRRREDENDVVQSAFKSFFLRAEKGDFVLESRDDLWNLLLTITLNKVRNVADRHGRKRRDHRREQRITFACSDDSSSYEWVFDLTDPTPEEAVIFIEEFERLLEVLSKAELRKIAMLKFEGYTNAEIAKELGRTERTIERKLERIRSEWGEVALGD